MSYRIRLLERNFTAAFGKLLRHTMVTAFSGSKLERIGSQIIRKQINRATIMKHAEIRFIPPPT